MALHNVALQSMNSPPVNPHTPVVVATEIHLHWGAGWALSSTGWSIGGPDAAADSVDALGVVMAVCEGFGLRVWMRCRWCTFATAAGRGVDVRPVARGEFAR